MFSRKNRVINFINTKYVFCIAMIWLLMMGGIYWYVKFVVLNKFTYLILVTFEMSVHVMCFCYDQGAYQQCYYLLGHSPYKKIPTAITENPELELKSYITDCGIRTLRPYEQKKRVWRRSMCGYLIFLIKIWWQCKTSPKTTLKLIWE